MLIAHLNRESIANTTAATTREADNTITALWFNNLNVPKESINSNKEVFLQAQNVFPDLVSVLAEIGPKMREKGKPIGYLINTLKGKISDAMSKKK